MSEQSSIGIVPLGNRILVRTDPAEHTLESGLVLPENRTDSTPCRGEVLAVGPGRKLEDGSYDPINLKVGDRVLWGRYVGTQIEWERKEYKIIVMEDVIGKETEQLATEVGCGRQTCCRN